MCVKYMTDQTYCSGWICSTGSHYYSTLSDTLACIVSLLHSLLLSTVYPISPICICILCLVRTLHQSVRSLSFLLSTRPLTVYPLYPVHSLPSFYLLSICIFSLYVFCMFDRAHYDPRDIKSMTSPDSGTNSRLSQSEATIPSIRIT